MNLAQEVSDMTVQKTSARTFCHENQNFYDWLIFPYLQFRRWQILHRSQELFTRFQQLVNTHKSWQKLSAEAKDPGVHMCAAKEIGDNRWFATNNCKDGEDQNHF